MSEEQENPDNNKVDDEQKLEKSKGLTNKDSDKKGKNKKKPSESEVEEIIKDMPSQFKRTIQMGMMQTSLRSYNPLLEKFNDRHIDKFLDYTHDDDNKEYKLKTSNRWFHLVYTVLATIIFIFLITYLLPNNKDLLVEILRILIIFAAGVGSGYGLKSHLDKKK